MPAYERQEMSMDLPTLIDELTSRGVSDTEIVDYLLAYEMDYGITDKKLIDYFRSILRSRLFKEI